MAYLSPLSKNRLHLPSCFFSKSPILPLRLPFPSLPRCQQRPSEFNPDHPGCGWEVCWGWVPAAGGSCGLGNCHLCDYPAGTVGPLLHSQDAPQPSAHVHLPVGIGKDAPGFACDIFNKDFGKLRVLLSPGGHHD